MPFSTPLGAINRATMGIRRAPRRFARMINRDVDLLKRRLVFDSTTASTSQTIEQPDFNDVEDDSLIQSLADLDIVEGKGRPKSTLCHSTPMDPRAEVYHSTPMETKPQEVETFHTELKNVEEHDQAEALNPHQEVDLKSDLDKLPTKIDLQESNTDDACSKGFEQDEFSENLNTSKQSKEEHYPDSYPLDSKEQDSKPQTEELDEIPDFVKENRIPEFEKDIDTNRLNGDTEVNTPIEGAESIYHEERECVENNKLSEPILYNLIQTGQFPFLVKHKYQFGNCDKTNEEEDFEEENMQAEAPVSDSAEIIETKENDSDFKENPNHIKKNSEFSSEIDTSRYEPLVINNISAQKSVSYEESASARSRDEVANSSPSLERYHSALVNPSHGFETPLACPDSSSPCLVNPTPDLVSPSPGLVARLGCSKARLRINPQKLFKTSPVNFDECLEIIKKKEEERMQKLNEVKPKKLEKAPVFSIYCDPLTDEHGNKIELAPMPLYKVSPVNVEKEEKKKKKKIIAEEERQKREIKLRDEERERRKNIRKARNLVDILGRVLR